MDDLGVWSVTVGPPEPATALAGRVAGLIRELLHQETPAELAYRSWAPDGAALTWPALGLGQLDIGHYAQLGSGATVQRPTGLLRRMSVGWRVIDEALDGTGTWVATDVFRRYDMMTLDDDVVRVDDAQAADLMIAWRADTPGPPAEGGAAPPRRATGTVDAVGERPVLDRFERRAVAGYLSRAPLVAVTLGLGADPFAPDEPGSVPLALHTDGTWIWSESAAYFADRYGIPPNAGLLADIRRHDYRWPELDEVRIGQIGQLVRHGEAV
jgi:hypothetical protein